MKLLIFRTDRVGDFFLTSILINSIKRKYKNAKIYIVTSDKNYNFIKDLRYFEKVLLFPKKNIFSILKFINFFNKIKLDCIIVSDSKDRSILISTLIKSNIKIINVRKKIFTLLNFFKNTTTFFDNEKDYAKISIIKKNLKLLKCNFIENDLNIFGKNINFKNYKKKFRNIISKKFVLFNFDEKWIYQKYINSYTNIEPTYEELKSFLNTLVKNYTNIIITNGPLNNYLFNKLKTKFSKIRNGIYIKHVKNKHIILLDKINLRELIYIISNSRILITCHGAPTHIASSLNIPVIDIFEKSRINFYKLYNKHLRNYSYLYRDNFNRLSKRISDKLSLFALD